MNAVTGLASLILIVGLGTGCSSTPHKLKSEETSPHWSGQVYKDLLIVGAYEDRAFRTSSEASFSEELKDRGVSATPSYQLFPQLDTLQDEGATRNVLAGSDHDGILTVATIEAGQEYTYADHMETRGWVRILGGEPGIGTSLGGLAAYVESGAFSLHVSLWDADTQQLIWQATTDSYSMESPSEQIKELADFMVETLKARGLI